MLLNMFCLNAQYIERFNSLSFPPNNAWSSALPTGMAQYNLDGLQAANQIAAAFPNNEAWVTHILEKDTFAVSHSWYDPAGTSNDWLLTSAISVPIATATETPFLIWEAQAPDINYPDGYLVKISTTGNQPNDFSATPIFEEIAAPNAFTKRAISLANYAGQTIYIAYINNSTDKFMLYIDDIEVKNLPTQPDIALTNSAASRIAKVNEDVYLSGKITNNSALMIDSMNITWSDGTYTYTMPLTGLSIPPLQSYEFVHTTPFFANLVDENILALTVATINGTQDVNPNDNTQILAVSTVAIDILKAVVFEEVTGTWCGWCPRGIVSMNYMDSIYAASGQFIGISIHTQDTLAMDDYADSTGIHLIPRTNIDRTLFNQETNIADYETYFQAQKNVPAPAAINTTALYQNQEVWVQITANFATKISTGLRFAVILIEDNVHSENSSFDQVNLYYYYGSQNPMGGFEYLPDPVPAVQMWYQHVARALLGGYQGEANSLPSTVYEGNSATYNFYYTLPYYINPSHVKAIGVLIDEQTGRIYNAQSVSLTNSVTALDVEKEPVFSIFPNPASQELNISFETEMAEEVSISLYNSLGQKVTAAFYTHSIGKQTKNMLVEDLPAGVYLVGVSMKGKSFWRNVVVSSRR